MEIYHQNRIIPFYFVTTVTNWNAFSSFLDFDTSSAAFSITLPHPLPISVFQCKFENENDGNFLGKVIWLLSPRLSCMNWQLINDKLQNWKLTKVRTDTHAHSHTHTSTHTHRDRHTKKHGAPASWVVNKALHPCNAKGGKGATCCGVACGMWHVWQQMTMTIQKPLNELWNNWPKCSK